MILQGVYYTVMVCFTSYNQFGIPSMFSLSLPNLKKKKKKDEKERREGKKGKTSQPISFTWRPCAACFLLCHVLWQSL